MAVSHGSITIAVAVVVVFTCVVPFQARPQKARCKMMIEDNYFHKGYPCASKNVTKVTLSAKKCDVRSWCITKFSRTTTTVSPVTTISSNVPVTTSCGDSVTTTLSDDPVTTTSSGDPVTTASSDVPVTTKPVNDPIIATHSDVPVMKPLINDQIIAHSDVPVINPRVNDQLIAHSDVSPVKPIIYGPLFAPYGEAPVIKQVITEPVINPIVTPCCDEPGPTPPTYFPPIITTPCYVPVITTSSYVPAPTTPSYVPAPTTSSYVPAPTAPSYFPAPTTGGYFPVPTTSGYFPGPGTGTYYPGPGTGTYFPGPPTGYVPEPVKCSHVPVIPKCDHVPVIGKCSDVPVMTKCGHVQVAGKCSDVPVTGKCNHVPVTGKCSDFPVAGKCGDVQVVGKCGHFPAIIPSSNVPSSPTFTGGQVDDREMKSSTTTKPSGGRGIIIPINRRVITLVSITPATRRTINRRVSPTSSSISSTVSTTQEARLSNLDSLLLEKLQMLLRDKQVQKSLTTVRPRRPVDEQTDRVIQKRSTERTPTPKDSTKKTKAPLRAMLKKGRPDTRTLRTVDFEQRTTEHNYLDPELSFLTTAPPDDGSGVDIRRVAATLGEDIPEITEFYDVPEVKSEDSLPIVQEKESTTLDEDGEATDVTEAEETVVQDEEAVTAEPEEETTTKRGTTDEEDETPPDVQSEEIAPVDYERDTAADVPEHETPNAIKKHNLIVGQDDGREMFVQNEKYFSVAPTALYKRKPVTAVQDREVAPAYRKKKIKTPSFTGGLLKKRRTTLRSILGSALRARQSRTTKVYPRTTRRTTYRTGLRVKATTSELRCEDIHTAYDPSNRKSKPSNKFSEWLLSQDFDLETGFKNRSNFPSQKDFHSMMADHFSNFYLFRSNQTEPPKTATGKDKSQSQGYSWFVREDVPPSKDKPSQKSTGKPSETKSSSTSNTKFMNKITDRMFANLNENPRPVIRTSTTTEVTTTTTTVPTTTSVKPTTKTTNPLMMENFKNIFNFFADPSQRPAIRTTVGVTTTASTTTTTTPEDPNTTPTTEETVTTTTTEDDEPITAEVTAESSTEKTTESTDATTVTPPTEYSTEETETVKTETPEETKLEEVPASVTEPKVRIHDGLHIKHLENLKLMLSMMYNRQPQIPKKQKDFLLKRVTLKL